MKRTKTMLTALLICIIFTGAVMPSCAISMDGSVTQNALLGPNTQDFSRITLDVGEYPQEPNGDSQPITWDFYKVDEDDTYIVSHFILDYLPVDTNVNTKWTESDLFAYLNTVFVDEVFNQDVQNALIETENGRLCLMSRNEVYELSDGFRENAGLIGNATYIASTVTNKETNTWWLLPEYDEESGIVSYPYVDDSGNVKIDETPFASRGVRIACHVSANALYDYFLELQNSK